MKFGVVKTLVENKLIESFKNDNLKNDMSQFNKNLLKDKNFCKMMSIYDNLNENKGLDKETSNYLIDDMVSEFKSIKLSEKVISFIKSWTKDIISENKYEIIDNLLYSNLTKPEVKSIAKKKIVETLSKQKPLIESKKPSVPLSSMLKVANNTAKKYIETLSENEQKEIKEILTSDNKKLSEKFSSLKENTLSKLDKLILESDEEELKEKLTETKNRIDSVTPSKKEFIKLMNLNNNL